MSLLTTQNSKTSKGEKKNWITGILYLSPHKSGGYANLCAAASKGCIDSCLNTAGRGGMSFVKDGKRINTVLDGRQRKTTLMFENPNEFNTQLEKDILTLNRRAIRKGFDFCVRLNGTSDMPSLARKFAKKFPEIQFYDYTALPNPHKRTLSNYSLTFSRKENNWSDCVTALDNGINVAAVFKVDKNNPLPETYKGFEVINGDNDDLVFLHKNNGKGYIIGLKAKGKAKKDLSGFVIMTKAQRSETVKSLIDEIYLKDIPCEQKASKAEAVKSLASQIID